MYVRTVFRVMLQSSSSILACTTFSMASRCALVSPGIE